MNCAFCGSHRVIFVDDEDIEDAILSGESVCPEMHWLCLECDGIETLVSVIEYIKNGTERLFPLFPLWDDIEDKGE